MLQAQFMKEKQPFFKPRSNLEKSGNFFNYETSGNRAKQQNISVDNMKENTADGQFQRTNQDQAEGAGRLSTLHARLHQEADKIRRWKTQTEIELKKKEKQVQDAVQTIESLRKSILDLQLQNENLSLKLQEEMVNQEEIIQKIDATRNMCNLLKDHTAEVDERLAQCETERTELKYMEKTHLRQYEELSSKFSDLMISSTGEQEKLKKQLESEQTSREQMQSEWMAKTALTETQIQQLSQDCNSKDEHIDNLRLDLHSNQEAVDGTLREIASVKENLAQTEEEFRRQTNLLQESLDDLKLTKAEKVTLESHCHEVNKLLDETVRTKDGLVSEFEAQKQSHENTLLSLREEVNSAKGHLDEEKQRMKDVRTQLERAEAMIEDLKGSRDILIMEKSELATRLSKLEKEKVCLTELHGNDLSQLADLTEKCTSLQSELQVANSKLELSLNNEKVLQKDLDDCRTLEITTTETISKLREEIQEKQDLVQDFQSKLEGTRESENHSNKQIQILEEKIMRQCDQLKEVEQIVEALNLEKQHLSKELTEKRKEVTRLEKDAKKQSSVESGYHEKLEKSEEENTELREEIETLQNELDAKSKEADNIQEEGQASTRTLQEELAVKSKSTTELETKMKSMKTEVTSKNKQVKELEKEVKQLKTQVDKVSKVRNKFESELTETKEKLSSAASDNSDLNERLAALQEQQKIDKEFVKRAEEEVIKMKTEREDARKDKETAVNKCEYQMGEMMSTLNKYKQDNQKIVAQKEKEIEMIKAKLEDKISNKKHEEKLQEDLKAQLESLKQTLTEKEAEMDCLIKSEEKQIKQMETVMTASRQKDEEMQKLKEELNQLQEKLANKRIATVSPQKPQSEESSTNEDMNVPKTPKTPQTTVLMTPQVMKTPQRSILRQSVGSSVSKKRRVAFAEELDSPGDNSDSSSSELMEVELTEIENRFKEKKKTKTTPIPVRPSPRVRQSPNPLGRVESSNDNITRTPLRPVPRGPPASSLKKKSPKESAEIKKFNELFPRKPVPEACHEKTTKKVQNNIRKTPCKTASKFFKNSPKERMRSKLGKLAEKEDLAWFDLDSVFGFGPED